MVDESTKAKANYIINVMIAQAVCICIFIVPEIHKYKLWFNIFILSMAVAIIVLALFAKLKNNNIIYLAPILIIVLDYFRLYTFEYDLEMKP